MATNLLTKPTSAYGGEVQEYLWSWENQPLRVIYKTIGEG